MNYFKTLNSEFSTVNTQISRLLNVYNFVFLKKRHHRYPATNINSELATLKSDPTFQTWHNRNTKNITGLIKKNKANLIQSLDSAMILLLLQ